MGLDLVELVLVIEDEFGVHIDDEDASRLETPGAVADYLCSRLRTKESEPCPSQVGFYRLRKAISGAFGVERKLIAPDMPLSSIIEGRTRQKWRTLREAVGAKEFPQLERSRLVLVTSLFVLPAVLAAPVFAGPYPITWGVAAFMAASLAFNWATHNTGTEIPRKASTVGQLVPYVTSSNSTLWDRDSVLKRVIELTSDQLGIPEEQIREDSHFVKDLGAD